MPKTLSDLAEKELPQIEEMSLVKQKIDDVEIGRVDGGFCLE